MSQNRMFETDLVFQKKCDIVFKRLLNASKDDRKQIISELSQEIVLCKLLELITARKNELNSQNKADLDCLRIYHVQDTLLAKAANYCVNKNIQSISSFPNQVPQSILLELERNSRIYSLDPNYRDSNLRLFRALLNRVNTLIQISELELIETHLEIALMKDTSSLRPM